MNTPDMILSHIETLCETVVALSDEVGSIRLDTTLHTLRQTIDDYFAAFPENPPDLGVNVTDSASLDDLFG